MEYRLEDLKLLKEANSDRLVKHNKKPFGIEYRLSQEEKLAFVDKHYDSKNRAVVAEETGDGAGSYMLNLIKTFLAEKDILPKDSWNYVKTVSLKAWIRRNDPRKIIDSEYEYGHYRFAGTEFLGLELEDFSVGWGSLYDHSGLKGTVIDQWFHDVLMHLVGYEVQYRNDHDPMLLKIREIKKYADDYGYLGTSRIGTICSNADRFLDKSFVVEYGNEIPVPKDEELDAIIEAYKKTAVFMDGIKSELAGKLQ